MFQAKATERELEAAKAEIARVSEELAIALGQASARDGDLYAAKVEIALLTEELADLRSALAQAKSMDGALKASQPIARVTGVREIRLPDIGDFEDVPIIEIMVKAGDVVKVDQSVITLESDKATMDVSAPEDGVIGKVHVKVGDKVSQGVLLATYASGAGKPK